MSNLKYCISFFSVLAMFMGCGGGDDEVNPDAASLDAQPTGGPDAGGADAGPVGVASCADYCTAVTTNCTGANAQYPDENTCLSLCEAAGWELGEVGAQDGDTIACRTYHAGALAAEDATTHCPHAGPTGGNQCGTWCDVYCALNLTMCTGRNAQYTDDAACQTACATFADTGEVGDDMGDTVQCRIYHSGHLALRNPGDECTYTGEEPVNYCIDVSF